MSENPVKREEARRVWRLNKKEGVPVLEALETADISKDTYYEYKAEYESEWEGQILTAEEVERELERLRGEITDLSEKAEELGGAFGEVEDMFGEIEEQVAAERTAAELWDRMEKVEWRIQKFDEIEEESYPEYQNNPLDLREMREELTETMERQEELVTAVEAKAEASTVNRLETTVSRLEREVKKAPRSLMDLIFPGNRE